MGVLQDPNPSGAIATGGAPPAPQTAQPTSNPAGTYGSLASNPNFIDQIVAALYGGQATNLASGQLQTAQGLAQASEAGAGLQVGAANLTSSTGYDIANALLNVQGVGLQQQTAAGQQAVELGQYGLQQQQLALTPQELALEQQYLGTQQATAATQYGIEQQQFGIQAQQLEGNLAAQGAGQTVGAGQQRQLLGLEEQSAAAQYAQQQAGFSEQGGQLALSQKNAAIQQQLAALGQQAEQIGYGGQMGQLQLAAQQAGIPAQQAQSQLEYGLQQLGITQGSQALQGILQASQGTSTSADAMAAIQSAASLLGGLGPSFGLGY